MIDFDAKKIFTPNTNTSIEYQLSAALTMRTAKRKLNVYSAKSAGIQKNHTQRKTVQIGDTVDRMQ